MAARAACWAATVVRAAVVDWEAPAAQSVPLAAMTVMEAVVAVPVGVMAVTAALAVQMEALEVEEARAGGWSWATRGSYLEPSPLARRRAAARRARLVGATFRWPMGRKVFWCGELRTTTEEPTHTAHRTRCLHETGIGWIQHGAPEVE